MSAPRVLYLHGFASSPGSKKGLAFAERFAHANVQRLDLRVPSFEHLRMSAMIDTVRAAIGGERDRAVVIGSSLGGLTAARVAELDARVCGLVLMAPAFRLVERWRERLGDQMADWQRTGWLEVDDYATGGKSRVDHGFVDELAQLDRELPDVRVPTLVIHGRGDEVVPASGSREFVAGRPHVQLVELDDGHELTAQLPRVLDEAERFLAPWLGGPTR